MMVGVVRPLPAVLRAFRTGGGVPYAHYDADFCEGRADMNRTMFVNHLGSDWLPAVPDVRERAVSGTGRFAHRLGLSSLGSLSAALKPVSHWRSVASARFRNASAARD